MANTLAAKEEKRFIVKCRGLPWSAKDEDITKFFGSCELADEHSIVISQNGEGRATGEAFIEFATEKDFEKAMTHDREKMGTRYIEVFPSKYGEMEWARKRNGQDAAMYINDNVLRLRGIPYRTGKDAIMSFFAGIDINENKVLLTSDDTGRSSGEAYVQFNSKEDAAKALKKNKDYMGDRYIEIFPSSMAEAFRNAFGETLGGGAMGMGSKSRPGPYDREAPSWGRGFGRNVKSPGGNPNMMGNANMMGMGGYGMGSSPGAGNNFGPIRSPTGMGGKSGYVIKLRGMPYTSTKNDVAAWFSEVANPIDVEIDFNDEGRPSGDACAYFGNAEDAQKAMKKNKQNMGHRYVELFYEGCVGDPSGMENQASLVGGLSMGNGLGTDVLGQMGGIGQMGLNPFSMNGNLMAGGLTSGGGGAGLGLGGAAGMLGMNMEGMNFFGFSGLSAA